MKDTATVIYQLKMNHGKSRKNFLVNTDEEFVVSITQHIPEKKEDHEFTVGGRK